MIKRNYPNAWVVATISLLGVLVVGEARAERSPSAPPVKTSDTPSKVARISLDSIAEGSEHGTFNIGYLDRGSDLSYEGASSASLIDDFRAALLAHETFTEALRSAGYAGIALSQCKVRTR